MSDPTDTCSDGFRAMGSSVEVVVNGDHHHLAVARQLIDHLETCWSRFLPTSDISRLNCSGGFPVAVDDSTLTLLAAMRDGWAATQHAFDPTLLVPLIELGYGASRHDPSRRTVLGVGAKPAAGLEDVVVDRSTGTASVPAGCSLDPGGIGKGLAADLVVEAILSAGAAGALVSIGGDVRVGGRAPQEPGWLIGITDPSSGEETAQLVLSAGAVATSGTMLRNWISPHGDAVHHLLDPGTGRPVAAGSDGELVEVSVIAGSGAWAEVWTKAIFVRGAEAGFADLDRLGLAGRATFADGAIRESTHWPLFDRAARATLDAAVKR